MSLMVNAINYLYRKGYTKTVNYTARAAGYVLSGVTPWLYGRGYRYGESRHKALQQIDQYCGKRFKIPAVAREQAELHRFNVLRDVLEQDTKFAEWILVRSPQTLLNFSGSVQDSISLLLTCGLIFQNTKLKIARRSFPNLYAGIPDSDRIAVTTGSALVNSTRSVKIPAATAVAHLLAQIPEREEEEKRILLNRALLANGNNVSQELLTAALNLI